MPMLVAVRVVDGAETDLERHLFPAVPVEDRSGRRRDPRRGNASGAERPASGFTVIAITVVPGRPWNR